MIDVIRKRMLCRASCKPRGVAILFAIAFLIFSVGAPARAQQATEAQVKAAYLYNFGNFVRWQTDQVANTDSLQICVLGKDPFGPVLDATVANEKIDGKKIMVRRIASVQDGSQCRILFVSASEERRLRPIIAAAQTYGALTVSDIPHFAEQGGIIEFVPQQGKIRFEVNRRAAERSHLELSSQLLKIAIRVIEETQNQS